MQQIHIKLALHKLCYSLVIVGILCLFIPGNFIAFAESIPGGNVRDTTVRAVDIAQPAVVRIITNENAQLAVHFATQNTDVTFPQTPNGTYQISLSGTGTFITSRGDILTADHVVSPPKSDLNGALYGLAAQDVADYMNKNASTQVTGDQVLQQLTSGQLKNTPAYQKPSSSVFLSTAYTSQTNAINFSSLPTGIGINVDKIKMESPPDKQDTAIIHVPLTDTLSVPLGNSADVNPQDQLTIIGFPGNADVSQKPDSLLTPSLNQIYVSSLKTSNSGAPLIQVGGNVEHGDSGGPALDNQGNIVGVVSFGTTSSSGGLNGTSFLQASSSAQSMIKSLKLNTAPGSQQKLWEQAFNDYASTSTGHWSKAQQEFAQLIKSYPLFKASQQFQNYTQTQVGTQVNSTSTPAGITTSPSGKGQTTSPTAGTSVTWQATALTIGAVAIMIILAAILFGAALRQKTKAKRTILKSGSSVRNQTKDSHSSVSRPTPPTSTTVPSANPKTAQPASATNPGTLSLKVWPCGHMNRSTARFCSVCGELAPTSAKDS